MDLRHATSYYEAAAVQLKDWTDAHLTSIQKVIEAERVRLFGEGGKIVYCPINDPVWPLYFERVKTQVERRGFYCECERAPADEGQQPLPPALIISVLRGIWLDYADITAFIKVTWD